MRITGVQNVALTVGAILGSLCLLAALAAFGFGVKPLMFKSGSMEPTIATGALALSFPVSASDIVVGDIVSTENAAGTRITHRVAAVAPAANYTKLTLKGDANDVVDAEIYAVTEVDRIFWSVPLLGYAVAWLSSPVAMFLGGLFTAYLLYVAFGANSRRAESKHSKQVPIAGVAAAGVLLLAASTLQGAPAANAVFTSSAAATSTFTAATVSPPQQPKCVLTGDWYNRRIALSWSHSGVVPASTYTVEGSNGAVASTGEPKVSLRTSTELVGIKAINGTWSSKELSVNVNYESVWWLFWDRVTCTEVQ